MAGEGKDKKHPKAIIYFVLLIFILFMLFVNVMIKKTIDKSVEIAQPAAIFSLQAEMVSSQAVVSRTRPISPADSGPSVSDKKSPRNSSKTNSNADKEIIYEPSIKGDILLQ